MLCPSPLFLTYPEALSPEECAAAIALMTPLETRQAGLVDGQAEASIRRTEITWLGDTPDTAWLHARLARLMRQAQEDGLSYLLDGFEEEAQIARYADGGFYDWHIDRGGQRSGRRRKLSVVVQLSPPQTYEGGLLELNPAGRVIAAPVEQGSAIVFPAFVLHRVTPVTAGSRYSLTQWIHGPDFV